MCVLKIYSDKNSFELFSKRTDLPVYSIYNKGELKNKKTHEKYSDFRISFDVSEKEWDDFEGQVNDSIKFMEKYTEQINELCNTHSISEAYLDFPIWSRLDDNIVNQNEFIPRELIKCAGRLNIGIELGIYSKNAFEFDN
jgi:hypothetical protein